MKRRLIFALVLFAGCSVVAQQPVMTGMSETKLTLPDGPPLNPVPDFAQWVVSIRYGDDSKKQDPNAPRSTNPDTRPRKITFTKTGTLVHELQADGEGKAKDIWINKTTEYVKAPADTTWFQPDGISIDALPSNGYSNWEWVNAGTFVGTVVYGSGSCLVFAPGGPAKVDLSDTGKQKKALESQPVVAYVDFASRMPVALRYHGEIRTYRFDPPPTQMQTLPPDLTAQLKKADEARSLLEMRAPRPY